MTDNATQQALKQSCTIQERADSPVLKVQRLAYLRLPRPELQRAVTFFTDFGLQVESSTDSTVYLRTQNTQSHAIILERRAPKAAMGFEVESEADLAEAASRLGVKVLQRADDDPLGGSYIQLTDPENNLIEVNAGFRPLTPVVPQPPIPTNSVSNIKRENDIVRFTDQPPSVAKLGHTVFGVRFMQKTIHWYQQTLGFIVSDFQMLPDDPIPTVAFMRCNRGSTLTDHHTIAISSAVEVGHLHTAFEVPNVDAIGMGAKWLLNKGYKHSWGIGRHILGSQIFDYWRDPWGFQFEHYSDGDVFDASRSTGYELFNSNSLHQWGPPVTQDMLGNKPSFSLLKTVFSRLTSKGDLTLKRLKRMLNAT